MLPAGNYLLFGRTGVGKSSIINTLAQASLANIDNARVCTQQISSYRFDSPGGVILFMIRLDFAMMTILGLTLDI